MFCRVNNFVINITWTCTKHTSTPFLVKNTRCSVFSLSFWFCLNLIPHPIRSPLSHSGPKGRPRPKALNNLKKINIYLKSHIYIFKYNTELKPVQLFGKQRIPQVIITLNLLQKSWFRSICIPNNSFLDAALSKSDIPFYM